MNQFFILVMLPYEVTITIHPFQIFLKLFTRSMKDVNTGNTKEPVYIALGYPVMYRKIRQVQVVAFLCFTLEYRTWQETEVAKKYPKGFHYANAHHSEINHRLDGLQETGFFN